MSIAAVDLDHDGVDEIIVAYNHMPEAPSYFVLYEPRIDRSRIVFEAMGGHRFAGAEDIDGDGRPELIISGINNGVNWYNALAAVRIHPWVNDTLSDEAAIPKSPDMFNVEDNNLVWYTLMPRGREPEQPSGFQWNGAQRTVTLNYVDRAPVTVSYDGFLTSETAPLSPRDREAFRRAAWFHFCKSRQLLFGGFGSEAVVEAEAAVTSAHDARQSILVEVMRCAFAKTLIAVGRTSEGDAIMRELVTASENAPELSYDAGRAFHLRGDIDRAVEWYERGLAAGAPLEVGKSKHEFIQAIVLALGERGEWKRAADETERFRRGYLKVRSDWTAMYREFIRWRTGKTPELEDIEATLGSTDLLRYWVLEFRNARGEDPLTLLPEVEREISWGAEPLGPLWSLKAELLIRSGHPDEGAAAIRHAWDIASADATRNLIARGHLPLIRERLRRYSKDGSG
ncbi:MAG TPA: VCBS repeat-containing protein [Thermoanaerobaculia bacterium]|nr:VCBS repeat-containing protein [Thermoanaerobaculia bacterium]